MTGTPTVIQQDNDVAILSTGNVGIGTTVPAGKIDIIGNASTAPIIARNMETSNATVLANKQTLSPILADSNGVMIKQFTPVSLGNSYYLDGSFPITIGGGSVPIFTGINDNTVVSFRFATNLAFGNGSRAMLYGQISFTARNGFRVSQDWNSSGDTLTEPFTLNGEGTNTLTFDAPTQPDLIFSYSGGVISVNSTTTVTQTNVLIYDGKKIR
ncbi:hypothetical protein [Chryseobacterium sp. MMS23-Vi53]|uniref:hypothetical protein n=1 Tax=Chryseobacterium sp. MMS23-Vi53 TaxID=3386644 RepID=UPI0039ED38A1